MKILLLLFFFATLTSQSAMDLFATLIALVFIKDGWNHWRKKGALNDFFIPTGFEWMWLVWFGIATLSLIANQKLIPGLEALSDFKWILCVYAFGHAMRHLPTSFRDYHWPLGLIVFCSAYSITIWHFRYDPFDPQNDFSPWSGGVRSGGFLSNPMTFAHVYGLHFCMWLGLLLTAVKYRTRSLPLLLVACGVVGLALLVSFTRGAWLGVGAAFIVMALTVNRRWGLITVGAVLVGVFVLANTWKTFGDRALDLSRHGDERTQIWRAHWHLFTENPVLGVGPKQSPPLVQDLYRQWGVREGTQIGHAHNQYLHWLTTMGVPGLLAALSFFVAMWWRCLQLFRTVARKAQSAQIQEGLLLGALGAQTMWFVGALTESNFEHSKVRYVLALIWAYVIVQSYLIRKQQSSGGSQ